MNINKTKLLDNFINIKNIANLYFLVCFENLFCKAGFKNNIGSYILFSIILFHIINFIIFYHNQFNSLKRKITNIINIAFRMVKEENIITRNSHKKRIYLLLNLILKKQEK